MDVRARRPRSLRYDIGLPGPVHFVTLVTEGRRRHFLDVEIAAPVCGCIADAATWPQAHPIAWVLMPDHWHGLVRLEPDTSVAACVATFKLRTARAAAVAGLAGELWSASFHQRVLRRDAELLGMARYLVANPVRAGLAARARDYPYWHGAWDCHG
jgi:REP element-mobilizing transposase RayT